MKTDWWPGTNYLTESTSNDECLPCSPIFLEGFNELFHWFDELFHALSSISLEGFDKIFRELLLLLMEMEFLKRNCFEK